jgi:Na+-driven multidrug efflux pump
MNVSHMVRGLSESFGVVAKRRVVAKIKNRENLAAGKTANMILVSTVIYALVVA